MKDYTPALIPESTYHVFNHAVSTDNLFISDENYRFFLKKYTHYIAPVADTFAYCLLPNHFHFALRIKSERELAIYFKSIGKQLDEKRPKFQTLEKLVSLQFSHMFNSYTQALNKQCSRKGVLFRKPFRRLLIETDSYFSRFDTLHTFQSCASWIYQRFTHLETFFFRKLLFRQIFFAQ
jgi:putative transposase